MNYFNILFYSTLIGISWGLTYYYIRRIPNPELNLLDKHGNIKHDLQTKIKLNSFFYDAVYGGLAIGISHLIVRLFRESSELTF